MRLGLESKNSNSKPSITSPTHTENGVVFAPFHHQTLVPNHRRPRIAATTLEHSLSSPTNSVERVQISTTPILSLSLRVSVICFREKKWLRHRQQQQHHHHRQVQESQSDEESLELNLQKTFKPISINQVSMLPLLSLFSKKGHFQLSLLKTLGSFKPRSFSCRI